MITPTSLHALMEELGIVRPRSSIGSICTNDGDRADLRSVGEQAPARPTWDTEDGLGLPTRLMEMGLSAATSPAAPGRGHRGRPSAAFRSACLCPRAGCSSTGAGTAPYTRE